MNLTVLFSFLISSLLAANRAIKRHNPLNKEREDALTTIHFPFCVSAFSKVSRLSDHSAIMLNEETPANLYLSPLSILSFAGGNSFIHSAISHSSCSSSFRSSSLETRSWLSKGDKIGGLAASFETDLPESGLLGENYHDLLPWFWSTSIRFVRNKVLELNPFASHQIRRVIFTPIFEYHIFYNASWLIFCGNRL